MRNIMRNGPSPFNRPALAISAVLAALLNGAALYMGAGLTPVVGDAGQARIASIQIVPDWQPPRPLAHAVPAAPPLVAAASPSATVPHPVGRGAAAVPHPTQPEASLPVLAAVQPQLATKGPEIHFYRFDEVELPAAPESDWNIDAVALDASGIERLVIDLYVGMRGEVLDCRIVEPSMSEDLRQRFETRLSETLLKPAMRDGRPVPSMRRIEMTVS